MQRYANKALLIVVVLLLFGCYPADCVTQERPVMPAGGFQWVTPAGHALRLQHYFFYSALAKTKVSCHFYTQEIYDKENRRRFAVLYWLHGSSPGLAGIPHLVKHFDAAVVIRELGYPDR